MRLTGRHPFNVEPPLPELWRCAFLTRTLTPTPPLSLSLSHSLSLSLSLHTL